MNAMSGEATHSVLDEFLWNHRLAKRGEQAAWTALSGGVSSDIWRVDVGGNTFCVKRALGKLKVSADWFASPQRNAYEWAWLNFAATHLPDHVPKPLAHDPEAGILAMSYLPESEFPVWKAQLLSGEVRPEFGAEVGCLLGQLHSASVNDRSLVSRLGDTASFEAIRLDPYLIATSVRHAGIERPLRDLAERTKSVRIAAVHGDISPKNILTGPKGPVFLDAEAAWFGDPAFDLAFCLNHLLLKCLARPARRLPYLRSYAALSAAYLHQVDWEPRDALEYRAATLLPALLLARVDGKSPVEYLTNDRLRQVVRVAAIDWIEKPCSVLADLARGWEEATEFLACSEAEQ
jgi:fructosamine-3-kinase